MSDCGAVLWHGPGHQSKTYCQRPKAHLIHEAEYSSAHGVARWKGQEAHTGPWDEPPWVEDDDREWAMELTADNSGGDA
jgi:hypothetical protein